MCCISSKQFTLLCGLCKFYLQFLKINEKRNCQVLGYVCWILNCSENMVSMELETENSVENTENHKRKLNKTILDNFSNLVKPNEGVRIKGSVNLLRYLSENSLEKVGFVED